MTARSPGPRPLPHPALPGALLAGALALAAWAMAPRLVAEASLGPICGGHAAWALHCPACYAAAALVGVAMVLMLGRLQRA